MLRGSYNLEHGTLPAHVSRGLGDSRRLSLGLTIAPSLVGGMVGHFSIGDWSEPFGWAIYRPRMDQAATWSSIVSVTRSKGTPHPHGGRCAR